MKRSALLMIMSALLLFLLGSSEAYAQPNKPKRDGDRHMFVEIDNLDEATYAQIMEALDGNEQMSVRQVCIPAHVIMLDLPASNKSNLDDNYSALRDLVVTKTSLTGVKLLAEYGEKDFLDRCKKYRGSK
ncbi:MAG: hypothetical protein JNM00_02910 [Flavobacteriales bacterium]|nr:hypothetical protein [Flavobacteriales bacterium]